MTRAAESPLVEVSDVVLHVPVSSSRQLGGSLFEQTALILLDSLVYRLGRSLGGADALLRAQHANLQ